MESIRLDEEPVLKTGDAERHRGFESYRQRHKGMATAAPKFGEILRSGSRGSSAKGVDLSNDAWVQIPLSPPYDAEYWNGTRQAPEP